MTDDHKALVFALSMMLIFAAGMGYIIWLGWFA